MAEVKFPYDCMHRKVGSIWDEIHLPLTEKKCRWNRSRRNRI